MDDKMLMENLLISVKSASNMYLSGTIEASTPQVRNAFDSALTKCLQMQNEIYTKMTEKGWYVTQPVEQKKINQTVQKFATMQASVQNPSPNTAKKAPAQKKQTTQPKRKPAAKKK